MNQERPIADAGKQPHATDEPLAAQNTCYIDPAPLAAVLFDQLEYLVEHHGEQCSPGCLDCGRLIQVTTWLMLPFAPGADAR